MAQQPRCCVLTLGECWANAVRRWPSIHPMLGQCRGLRVRRPHSLWSDAKDDLSPKRRLYWAKTNWLKRRLSEFHHVDQAVCEVLLVRCTSVPQKTTRTVPQVTIFSAGCRARATLSVSGPGLKGTWMARGCRPLPFRLDPPSAAQPPQWDFLIDKYRKTW